MFWGDTRPTTGALELYVQLSVLLYCNYNTYVFTVFYYIQHKFFCVRLQGSYKFEGTLLQKQL